MCGEHPIVHTGVAEQPTDLQRREGEDGEMDILCVTFTLAPFADFPRDYIRLHNECLDADDHHRPGHTTRSLTVCRKQVWSLV